MVNQTWHTGLLLAVIATGCSSGSKSYTTSVQTPAGPQPVKQVDPSNRPIAPQTVDLKFVELAENPLGCNYGVRDGKVSCPFPNAAGKLTIEVRDGKVYGDTNGDGAIDAKDALAVAPNKGVLKFDMTMPGGRTVAFPVRIGEYRTFGGSSSDPYLELSWLGALEANVGDWTICHQALSFDAAPQRMFSNVKIEPTGSDPRAGSYVAISQTYCIAGRLYNVKLSDDLTKLTIAPYTGDVAEVRFSYTLAGDAPPPAKESWNREDRSGIFLAHKTNIQQSEACANQTSKFVPGEYQATSIFLTRFTNNGEQLYVSARLDPKTSPVILKPGPNEIHVGAPFKLDFAANRNADEIVLTDVTLTGRLGETYAPPGNGGKPEFAAYIRAGARETKLAKLEYG